MIKKDDASAIKKAWQARVAPDGAGWVPGRFCGDGWTEGDPGGRRSWADPDGWLFSNTILGKGCLIVDRCIDLIAGLVAEPIEPSPDPKIDPKPKPDDEPPAGSPRAWSTLNSLDTTTKPNIIMNSLRMVLGEKSSV